MSESTEARYLFVSSTVGREMSPRRSRRCIAPPANALARSLLDLLLRPRFGSSNSPLLFKLFSARLKHLIVGRFFPSVTDEMFTDRLFFVVNPGTGHTMTAVVRSYLPLCGHFRIIRRFFGRVIIFSTHQFLARATPIGIGKFVWIALVDHRNLARASLDVFGGGNSHSVAMKLD